MKEKSTGIEIHDRYGCPKEWITCPGCGKIYRGKVCLDCEECGKCCTCEKPNFVPADLAKQTIADHEFLDPLREKKV